jgi:flavodoxin
MKCAVRYYSRSGNTRLLAEAIAEELGVPAV